MKCADGTKHIWHFFVRLGEEFRSCKKCSHTEIRVDDGNYVPAPKKAAA